jgi:hypothetical protein
MAPWSLQHLSRLYGPVLRYESAVASIILPCGVRNRWRYQNRGEYGGPKPLSLEAPHSSYHASFYVADEGWLYLYHTICRWSVIFVRVVIEGFGRDAHLRRVRAGGHSWTSIRRRRMLCNMWRLKPPITASFGYVSSVQRRPCQLLFHTYSTLDR